MSSPLARDKKETDIREGIVPMRKSAFAAIAAGMFGLGLFTGGVQAGEAAKLVPYEVVGDISIPKSLTGKPGDPVRGRKIMANRKKGNCLACHKIDKMRDFQFHGEIGPDLNDIASNMPIGEMRLRLVNPKIVNPDTIMPAFYKNTGLTRVMKKFQGKTILNAQEIEDVLAYLKTLKQPQ